MMIEKNAKKMGKRALSLLLALLMLAGCMGVSAFAYEPCDEHVPAEPVAENEAAASCTEGGSYDEVVYCSVCGEELSRETVTVEALGHEWDEGTVTLEPTTETEGVMTYSCLNCDEVMTAVLDKLPPEESEENDLIEDLEQLELEQKSGTSAIPVSFYGFPEGASITVYDIDNQNEDGSFAVVEAEEDGLYFLLPGSYLYSVICEGYEPTELLELEIDETANPEEGHDIEIVMTESLPETDIHESEDSDIEERITREEEASIQSANTDGAEEEQKKLSYDNTVITGFAELETSSVIEERKLALSSLLEDLPEEITVFFGGIPIIGNGENMNAQPEGSEQRTIPVTWECKEDYNKWVEEFEFQPVTEGYTIAEGVNLPTIKVIIEDLSIPATGYVKREITEEIPVVGSQTGLLMAVPYYDGRNEGRLPPVRSQSPYGACWTFSAIGAIEADLISNGQASTDIDLSELHLAYFTTHNYTDPKGCNIGDEVTSFVSDNYLDAGGNNYDAYHTLVNMVGPAAESSVPYSIGEAYAPSGVEAKSQNVAQITGVYLINVEDFDAIKSAIMNHGAVSAGMWAVSDGSENLDYYYNSVNNCYYCPYNPDEVSIPDLGGGHAVLLVGWDDSFSKNNFPTNNRPEGNGAWLVRNSWGSDRNSYYGYFWMSYYDQSYLASGACYAYDADTSSYGHVYAYDSAVGCIGGYKDILKANDSIIQSFTVDAKESVEAVGMDLDAGNIVTVSVTDGTNTVTGNCTSTFRGYYLIPLASKLITTKKTTLTVTVTYKKPGSFFLEMTGPVLGYYGFCGSGGFTKRDQYGSEDHYNFDACIKLFTNDNAANTYSISYNTDGGSSVATQTVAAGGSFTIPSASKDGYTLQGWNVRRSDGRWYVGQQGWLTAAEISNGGYTKALYTPGKAYAMNNSWTGGNTGLSFTFYAIWDLNILTVKYNVNGGTISSDTYTAASNGNIQMNGADYSQDWKYGKTAANGLPNASGFGLTKEGSSFVGWCVSKDGSGTIFDQNDNTVRGELIEPNLKNGSTSVTLYAIWDLNILTVKYNANGGTISSDTFTAAANGNIRRNGSDYSQDWKYGKTAANGLSNASAFGLTKAGSSFVGWCVSKAGSGTVFDQNDNTVRGEQIYPGLKDGNASVTLYAIWKANAPVKPADPVEEFVRRCYRLILGREGEAKGVSDWTNALKSGTRTGAEIVSGFINSQEFFNQRNSNEQVVTILYRAMLGREPDAGGKASWVSILDGGCSYDCIVDGFSGSQEFGGICASYGIRAGRVNLTQPRDQNPRLTAFVNRNYRYALNRQGEAGGLNDWCDILLQKRQTPQEVAHGFVFSPECLNMNLDNRAFLVMLYHLYMDREPDESGLNGWLAVLNGGGSREEVVYGFAQSREFSEIVASYGL